MSRCWMFLAVVACSAHQPPVQAPAAVVTADAGPPTFATAPRSLGHWSWADYQREAAPYADFTTMLAAPYPGASPAAFYGFNLVSEGKNVGWVVDGDRQRGFRLVVDMDHDGELADEAIWPMTLDGAAWHVDVTMLPPHVGDPIVRIRVACDGVDVLRYDDVVRTGAIAVAGEPTRFAIACSSGDCTTPAGVRVGFDLDGDGAIDLDSAGSYERYTLRERTVVVRGRTYDFEISPDGGRLTLRPSAVAQAPRPTLLVGSTPPPFELTDGAQPWSLAAQRGKVVLIDFFSAGCHFCTEDEPWLAGMHDRYRAALEVVTVSATDGPPAHAWPTFVEAGEPGPVAALYRVDAYPAYFVVDRDGTIACTRCLHDEAERVLARLMAGR